MKATQYFHGKMPNSWQPNHQPEFHSENPIKFHCSKSGFFNAHVSRDHEVFFVDHAEANMEPKSWNFELNLPLRDWKHGLMIMFIQKWSLRQQMMSDWAPVSSHVTWGTAQYLDVHPNSELASQHCWDVYGFTIQQFTNLGSRASSHFLTFQCCNSLWNLTPFHGNIHGWEP